NNSNGGSTTIVNTTITANREDGAAGQGGGVINSANLVLRNTLVAGNYYGPGTGSADDLSGPVSANYCLIGTAAAATVGGGNNIMGVGPRLGPLADNGGPTQTCALLAGSPAIDGGSNALSQGLTDQRGLARTVGVSVDIGAVESQTAPAATTTTAL